MDVRIAIPEEHVSAPVLNAGLEAVTRLNEQLIKEGSSPTFGQAVKSGVRWKPEPPGLESFDHGKKVAGRGWGDCDDLAPLHAATLRVSGEDPGARAVVFRSGPGRWHAIVKRSNGNFEDPSQTAGMNVRKGSMAAGIPPAVVGCAHRASVSGPVRPWVAVRRSDMGHLARVDVPIVDGVLPLVGGEFGHSLSFQHFGATPAKALAGCMAGACIVGGASELSSEEHLQKLWALSGLLSGRSAQDVAGECGVATTKDALMSLQDIAPALVQALREHWQDAKDLRDRFASSNGKGRGAVSGSPFSDRYSPRGQVLGGSLARAHGRKVSLAGTVNFGRAFDRSLGANPDATVGDIFSDIASMAAPVLKPLAKVVQPVVNTVQKVYSSLPKPLVAVLTPQALVTDFAIKNPSSIPMFGQLAAQAKGIYEQGIAQGKPVAQAVAAAHTALHPAMQHPAVAAAPTPAAKKAVALHIATRPPPPPPPKPVPAAHPAQLPTLAMVVRSVAPRVIGSKMILPAGTRHA